MPSASKADFDRNALDIENIWNIHGKASGTGKGRKHKVEILNRAVVVFIYACWEAYVEDVLREANAYLVASTSVSVPVAPYLKMPLEHALKTFHTANSKNTEELFEGSLGLSKLTKQWKWQNKKPHEARGGLDGLVRLRGRIAHRVSAGVRVGKADGEWYLDLVNRLVEKTDEAVARHITTISGAHPWHP